MDQSAIYSSLWVQCVIAETNKRNLTSPTLKFPMTFVLPLTYCYCPLFNVVKLSVLCGSFFNEEEVIKSILLSSLPFNFPTAGLQCQLFHFPLSLGVVVVDCLRSPIDQKMVVWVGKQSPLTPPSWLMFQTSSQSPLPCLVSRSPLLIPPQGIKLVYARFLNLQIFYPFKRDKNKGCLQIAS